MNNDIIRDDLNGISPEPVEHIFEARRAVIAKSKTRIEARFDLKILEHTDILGDHVYQCTIRPTDLPVKNNSIIRLADPAHDDMER